MSTNPDDTYRLQRFLQEAGKIFNLVRNESIRMWAVKYCMWLRDKHLNGVHADPPTSGETTKKLRSQLDSLADQYLKKE